MPVVDWDAIGVANVVPTNGARFYVDHAHPEYASPEVDNAFDAMVYDAAGDIILNEAAQTVADLSAQGTSVVKNHDPCPPLKLYKNNVDGKGASYGSHENYQYLRATDFDVLTKAIIRFSSPARSSLARAVWGSARRGSAMGSRFRSARTISCRRSHWRPR